MSDIAGHADSTFRAILIAARRAEQLISGARVRVTTRLFKPTTIALAELENGSIPWRVVTPEEFEQIKQQEQAARDSIEQAVPLVVSPVPLPLVAEVPVVVDDEESLEEELAGAEFDGEDDLGDLELPPEELLKAVESEEAAGAEAAGAEVAGAEAGGER